MQYKINKHLNEWGYDCDFTLEFNVKNPPYKGTPTEIHQSILQHESETFAFTKKHCNELFKKHKHLLPQAIDWSFAGRSSGWFVILCDGDVNDISDAILADICELVEKYYTDYMKELFIYYGEPLWQYHVKKTLNITTNL